MFDVCLIGTGGMMPLPRRWLTALMLKYNGHGILIDAGEGTQVAMRSAGLSFHDIDVILITHFHGDHISGLPGLLLSMGNAERTEPVTIVGPKGLTKIVGQLRCIAPELPFEIFYEEIPQNENVYDFFGMEVTAFKVNHNITCYGYSVNIKRAGLFNPEKAKELEIPLKLWNRLQKGEIIDFEGRTFTPDMVLGPERQGLKITYCTDSRPTDSIIRNAKGADIFICEGMYGEPEKQADAVAKKHMTFKEAANMAREAGVNEMWLTHFSPSMAHPKDYKKAAQDIFPNTVIAKDGENRTLRFVD